MGDARTDNNADQRDAEFMRRAIALGRRGAGNVAPNPMVGCLLVQDGVHIVGQGWHEAAGRPHAEVEAITCAGKAARGATAYVSLEPCNHHGRTGPCTEALIEAGVAEVVYAMADPNPIAAGGAERLLAAGVKVRGGVCEKEARHASRAWLHAIKYDRPYVIAKSAMSLDGRIATRAGESQWITGEESRFSGHYLRGDADAILVGAGTVIADDPTLTARMIDDTRYPLRVVLDSTARTSPGAKVYERTGNGALLATTRGAAPSRLAAFAEMGVEVLVLDPDQSGRVDLTDLLAALHERHVHMLMVEGGGAVLGAFFDADLIDEMELYIAPKIIGGGRPAFGGAGVERLSDAGRFLFSEPEMRGPDMMLRGVRRKPAEAKEAR